MMKQEDYVEERDRALAEIDTNLAPFALHVFSNVDVKGMTATLQYEAARRRMRLEPAFYAHTELASRARKHAMLEDAEGEVPGAVLLCFWLPAFSPVLTDRFVRQAQDKIAWEVERVKFQCASLLADVRKITKLPLLWVMFDAPAYPAYGIAGEGMSQRSLIQSLNQYVWTELEKAGNACCLDADRCVARVGYCAYYGSRNRGNVKAPFDDAGLQVLAEETTKYLAAWAGKVKKCLVLDCDQTLWGGVIAEEGFDGILLGGAYPGTAYQEFQEVVLDLYYRGIILAICSKNDEEDVVRVFQSHPGMVLKEEHIACMKVNWENKAANIAAIAQELNIGLDAIVFADDSPFETEFVRQALPEVEVLRMSVDEPEQNAMLLRRCGLFDALQVTEEDKQRGAMYRAEGLRKALRGDIPDIEDYLYNHLKMETSVFVVDDERLERAAQLCQRLNRFNLTTIRYTQDQLKQLQESGCWLRGLHVSDRFGSYGMVGLAVVRVQDDEAEIDTFLMSCRVLDRKVEDVFLRELVNELKPRRIIGRYVKTAKNEITADFYPKRGFLSLREDQHGQWFVLESAADLTVL